MQVGDLVTRDKWFQKVNGRIFGIICDKTVKKWGGEALEVYKVQWLCGWGSGDEWWPKEFLEAVCK
jgi:hypothetical protein